MPKLPVPERPPPREEAPIEGEIISITSLPDVPPAPTPSNLPIPVQPVSIQERELNDAMNLGGIFAASGMFPDIQSQAQAVVKILAGRAYGLEPFQAMNGIYIVQGRVTLSAALIAGLVKSSSKYDYRVREHTEQACIIDFYHGAQIIGTSEFTMQDATKAGLAGRPVWKSYPRNMLWARAMSNGVRWLCPDLTYSPVYTPDEINVAADRVEEITN